MLSILTRPTVRTTTDTRRLRRQCRRLLTALDHTESDVTILLTDDKEIQDLNSRYRGIEKPTDVLSFSQLNNSAPQSAVGLPQTLGDVIISVETALRQVREGCLPRLAPALRKQGVDPTRWNLGDELIFLATHGVLHLLGYDHMDENDAQAMFQREAEILPGLLTRKRPRQGQVGSN